MSLEVEGVVDGGMGGEESLGGRLALEELHLPFASSDRQVGILDPIVLTEPSGSVDLIQAQLAKRGSIRSQAIGRDRFGRNRLVAQQPRQKLQRRGVVPPALNHEIEPLAFIIDGPPEVHAPSADPADHLASPTSGSSRCHRGEGAGRRFLSRLAINGPNLMVQQRTVS